MLLPYLLRYLAPWRKPMPFSYWQEAFWAVTIGGLTPASQARAPAAVILRPDLSRLNFVDTFPWCHLWGNVCGLRPCELLRTWLKKSKFHSMIYFSHVEYTHTHKILLHLNLVTKRKPEKISTLKSEEQQCPCLCIMYFQLKYPQQSTACAVPAPSAKDFIGPRSSAFQEWICIRYACSKEKMNSPPKKKWSNKNQ